MSDDPYQTPRVEQKAEGSKAPQVLATVGLSLYLAAAIGLWGQAYGVIRAFQAIASSGDADPAVLASHISQSLLFMIYGSVGSIVGLVCMLIAQEKMRFRARWFVHGALLVSLAIAVLVPVGTFVGVIGAVFIGKRRKEHLTGAVALTDAELLRGRSDP